MTRLLPDSINARDGYKNTGFVIRYGNKEEEQAAKLREFAELKLAVQPITLAFSRQDTPWYLSTFI